MGFAMNIVKTFLFLLLGPVVLAGCQTEYSAGYSGSYVEEYETVEEYEDDGGQEDTAPQIEPESVYLKQFDMVDSYGYDSYFFPYAFLSISPFINGGLFDIYWSLDAYQDYYLELTISSDPSFTESQLIYTDQCDIYGGCHQEQALQCEFTPDLELNCGNHLGEYQDNYIGDWFDTFPQQLYLKLEICDDDFYYCEYSTKSVQFE